MRRSRSTAAVAVLALSVSAAGVAGPVSAAGTVSARETPPAKQPIAVGFGGAVTSVDADASRIGLQVLRHGGNAADAAIATAAALGVTEPYSSGIGGGGYFVLYDARTGQVETVDGRETAPRTMPRDAFIDPDTQKPYDPFFPNLVTSGVSVGTPGTLATWQRALRRWGTRSLAQSLRPATRLARDGFVVDQTFHDQTADNEERFRAFPATRRLFLRGGHLPRVGTRFRNPDLADTYDLIARRGPRAFYDGRLSGEIVDVVRRPPKTASTDLPVPPGYLTRNDLAGYQALDQDPTHVTYHEGDENGEYDVYGMAPSSSGGTTVGEALNILDGYDLSTMSDADALHRYLEASALAFADRGKYVGDPAYVDVPQEDLLSQEFADERRCLIDPDHVFEPMPTAAGDVESYDGECDTATARSGSTPSDTENVETTNLTVADRWGNVVEYTLTIEQTGGSGIVVPGRGFLLNNELTDFSAVYDPKDPNRIQPGKRPRSSMSPTILLQDGKPALALGSPGGSTIITTVLQTLFNWIDRDKTLLEAIEAPRAAQRNTPTVTAEPAFIAKYGEVLGTYGHRFTPSGDAFTGKAEIGAATGIEFGDRGLMTAVAEPTRRGGGSARVVQPQ